MVILEMSKMSISDLSMLIIAEMSEMLIFDNVQRSCEER
jgi:hypothetical protein